MVTSLMQQGEDQRIIVGKRMKRQSAIKPNEAAAALQKCLCVDDSSLRIDFIFDVSESSPKFGNKNFHHTTAAVRVAKNDIIRQGGSIQHPRIAKGAPPISSELPNAIEQIAGSFNHIWHEAAGAISAGRPPVAPNFRGSSRGRDRARTRQVDCAGYPPSALFNFFVLLSHDAACLRDPLRTARKKTRADSRHDSSLSQGFRQRWVIMIAPRITSN
jgi:hypothetical protein